MNGTRRFRSLHLENWKNFKRVDVVLQGRVFLVGPNAAGKSNFLDVFRFLRDLASPGGGLQEALRRRGGAPGVRIVVPPSEGVWPPRAGAKLGRS